MTELAFSLLVLPPQTAERVDFDLEPGVVLFAVLLFVLVNLLLAAVLYPYFRNSSNPDEGASDEPSPQDMVGEVPAGDNEPMEERVDDFLEDIEEQS